MNPTNTEQLIAYIVTKLSGNILKTTLMKFLYLVDLNYVRKYYKQFTDLEYIFYKNGPWAHQFDILLDKLDGFEIKAAKQKKQIRNEEYILYFKGTNPRFDPNNLSPEVTKIVDEIMFIFKKPRSQKNKILKDILDYVYKDTKPMKYAVRDKPIDFSYEFMNPEEKKYIENLNQEYLKSETRKLLKDMSKEVSKKDIYNFMLRRISLSEELLRERETEDEESLLF
jgi:hypothetical protein